MKNHLVFKIVPRNHCIASIKTKFDNPYRFELLFILKYFNGVMLFFNTENTEKIHTKGTEDFYYQLNFYFKLLFIN